MGVNRHDNSPNADQNHNAQDRDHDSLRLPPVRNGDPFFPCRFHFRYLFMTGRNSQGSWLLLEAKPFFRRLEIVSYLTLWSICPASHRVAASGKSNELCRSCSRRRVCDASHRLSSLYPQLFFVPRTGKIVRFQLALKPSIFLFSASARGE